ncbi:MAG: dTDP-4-dehydrorhamnose 3,5-epimerase [Alistipes sp.]|nr:dTDP-4-dehydrorhamnose 3,5-epimerase [Alistipes sp.]
MEIKYIPTALEGVTIIEPGSVCDNRGWFSQLYIADQFSKEVVPVEFVLENESYSQHGVIRGLHYQLPPFAQGKLVRVVEGSIIDVAVDVRDGSPTFGRYIAVELSAQNRRQLYIPRGFAHGFSVPGSHARVNYKCDNTYSPAHEVGIRFDDPAIGVDWKIPGEEIIVSAKDARQAPLSQVKLFAYGERIY